jgi:hypothetical protein
MLCLGFALAAWAVFHGLAQADNIDLCSFGNVSWTTAQQGVAIQIKDVSATPTPAFYGYDLGLLLVPKFTTSTTMSVSGAANPATNSVMSSWQATTPILSYWPPPPSPEYSVSNSGPFVTPKYNATIPSSPANMVTLSFGGTPAAGTWNVYVDSGVATDYTDINAQSYTYANPSGSGVAALGAAAFVDGTGNVLLGTVTVAAPEPSTLVLLAAGALGMAGCAWRRKRAAARVA